MEEIKIVSNYDSNKVLLCGKYESVKDCLEKNRGANLRGAYLEGANLRGAYLEGANLRGANLEGAKGYYLSYDFALEIIRRQKIEYFTKKEWSIIGKIATHRFCWDKITTEYKTAISIFKKLDKLGYLEFLKKFNNKI